MTAEVLQMQHGAKSNPAAANRESSCPSVGRSRAAGRHDSVATTAEVGGTPTIVVGRQDLEPRTTTDLGPEPEPGARFGRYVIMERLGQGGMGVVYGAYDSELDRKVALKLLRGGGSMREGVTEGRARLLREAKSMARLSHPNVVAVHDVGSLDGRIFIAMEFVDGSTLTQWAKGKDRSWREVRDIFVQAGLGLGAAHAAGLVHRDFKPDNVLVGKDGRVRVTDFGLARPSDSSEVESSDEMRPVPAWPQRPTELTQPGLVMGTPPYMAPESGRSVAADHRMDQFSFCVAFFEALYGRRPFRGRSRKELRAEIERGRIRSAPKWAQAPKWLHHVVKRGLAADPAQRWRTMDELVSHLRRRRRLRRRVLAVAVTLAAGTGAAASWALAGGTACDHAASEVSRAWGAEQREAAEAGVLASGSPRASESWALIEASVDGYTDSWARMRVDACQATARGEQSGRALDERIGCLDRRLDAVESLAQSLARGSAELADSLAQTGAAAIANRLPPLGPCGERTIVVSPPREAPAGGRHESQARSAP